MSQALAQQTPDTEFQILALSAQPDVTPEELAQDSEGITVVYPRAKIPAGGALNFELPSDDPDRPLSVPDITGVIVDHYPVNSFWASAETANGTPPDCSSIGGQRGVGSPGGDCATCPLNQWGTDNGGPGKACKNMHRVYIQREDCALPVLLTLPPTSLRPFSEYVSLSFSANRTLSSSALTRVSLKKVKSPAGNAYSQAVFSVVKRFSPETAAELRNYSRLIKQHTRAVQAETEPPPQLFEDDAAQGASQVAGQDAQQSDTPAGMKKGEVKPF